MAEQGTEPTKMLEDQAAEIPEIAVAAPEAAVEDASVLPADAPHPAYPGPASLAVNGRDLAYFLRDSSGFVSIWTQEIEIGGSPIRIPTSVNGMDDSDAPQWSPDATAIAVSGLHPAGGRTAIWIIDVENGQARLLIDHAGSDAHPRWSPDGTSIAFVSARDGRSALNVAPADGTGPSYQLSDPKIGESDHHPCWSADGQRIGFARKTIEAENTGDHIWCANIGTGECKQITKRLANRTDLRWSPDRPLVMHVTDDAEFLNVAVVNVDNAAGWNISSEPGEKAGGHYSKDGQRVIYRRLKDGVVRLCERAASSASAELLDPGNGVVLWALWVNEREEPDEETGEPRTFARRVVYCHAPATGGYSIIVQEPKAEAAHKRLPTPATWSSARTLMAPSYVEIEASGRKLGGLVYRPTELSGPTPAVLLVSERLDQPVRADVDLFAQALVSHGLTVYVPSLTGQPGFGKKVVNALKDGANSEAETLELRALVEHLRGFEGVDKHRVAIAGTGHGGSLALLLAGSRPGSVEAVVAVDPVGSWDHEFDQADGSLRDWMIRTLGLPALNRGRYALRTPATFAGVIDAPTVIISTSNASDDRVEQAEDIVGLMQELGAPVQRVKGDGAWEAGASASAFLRTVFTAIDAPSEDGGGEVTDEAVAADEI